MAREALARAQLIKMREFSKLVTGLLFREYRFENGIRSYDANGLRRLLDSRAAAAVIPSRTSPTERFRRIATRFEKLTYNCLAGLWLVEALVFWT